MRPMDGAAARHRHRGQTPAGEISSRSRPRAHPPRARTWRSPAGRRGSPAPGAGCPPRAPSTRHNWRPPPATARGRPRSGSSPESSGTPRRGTRASGTSPRPPRDLRTSGTAACPRSTRTAGRARPRAGRAPGRRDRPWPRPRGARPQGRPCPGSAGSREARRGARQGAPPPPRRYDTAVPRVALTFDDGPGPATASILDVLSAAGVRATFFILGKNVVDAAWTQPVGDATRARAVVARAVADGHVVGNHTFSHFGPDLWLELAADIARCDGVLAELGVV